MRIILIVALIIATITCASAQGAEKPVDGGTGISGIHDGSQNNVQQNNGQQNDGQQNNGQQNNVQQNNVQQNNGQQNNGQQNNGQQNNGQQNNGQQNNGQQNDGQQNDGQQNNGQQNNGQQNNGQQNNGQQNNGQQNDGQQNNGPRNNIQPTGDHHLSGQCPYGTLNLWSTPLWQYSSGQECSVWTESDSYKVGEQVTIYYSIPSGTTASLTAYLTDGSVTGHADLDQPLASIQSITVPVGYPTGERRVVLQTSNGCSDTCYFNVY